MLCKLKVRDELFIFRVLATRPRTVPRPCTSLFTCKRRVRDDKEPFIAVKRRTDLNVRIPAALRAHRYEGIVPPLRPLNEATMFRGCFGHF